MTLTDYEDDDEKEEDQEKSSQKAPRTQTMDPEAFADALVARLERQRAGNMPQSQKDEIAETLAYLKKEGYSQDFIEANANILMNVDSKMERRIKEEVSKQTQVNRLSQIEDRGAAQINVELKSSFKDMPELKEYNDEIRASINAKIAKNEKFLASYNKGILDSDLLSEITESVINKFVKVAGAEKPAQKKDLNLAAKGNSKGKQVVKETKESYDEDDLLDHQRQAYYAFLTTNKKKLRMPEDEAKKKAYELAAELPNIRPKKSVLD